MKQGLKQTKEYVNKVQWSKDWSKRKSMLLKYNEARTEANERLC